ncbi:MAG: hypothetical protein PVI81_04800 [Anaerolineales bacterium]|jgi:hypothetical protein
MQQYANHTLIKRNGRFGRAIMYLGLGLTIAAAVVVFRNPNFVLPALILMLIGGLFSQIGTALFNRFGREPRMDQIIDASLKGLDDRYAIFHYVLGSDHVLVTPEGVFALVPRWEKGELTYADGKWNQKKPKGRLPLPNRTRTIRNLEKEAYRELQSLERSLQKYLKSSEELNTQPMLIFIAEDANLDLDGAPILATHRKKLKDTVRNLERGKSLGREDLKRLAKSVLR